MSEATKNQLAEEQAEKAAAAQTTDISAEEQAEKGKGKGKGKGESKGKTEETKDVRSGRTAPEEYGPDVTVYVPIDKLNPGLTEIPVHINEYSWVIKRGEKQIVPEAVADVLHQAGYL